MIGKCSSSPLARPASAPAHQKRPPVATFSRDVTVRGASETFALQALALELAGAANGLALELAGAANGRSRHGANTST